MMFYISTRTIMYRLLLCFLLVTNTVFAKTAQAIFAGGCFWCVEADFDKVKGVLATISGFDGGSTENPTYSQVSAGGTAYAESVKVIYNPDQVSYRQLVDYFVHHIDPTVKDAQFCDHGHQYRSAIFYLNDQQKKIALAARKSLEKQFKQVYTEVVPSTRFYAAEGYHQNYYQKNPLRYKYYRYRCGRDQRVKEVWSHAKN
ncbi:peptide-methionine (S)-S-oxide reductase MsrA [Legionella spiritensis]|uniref:peptide-methionine (S)-S-oxide reductase MsrA n=1 Tax=Legionella spiritensis TaxID=452 RepID=UPI001E30F08D|nr:peptide-methionine (S)-S-oxide reductase MsrA [Legionella spiritensis]